MVANNINQFCSQFLFYFTQFLLVLKNKQKTGMLKFQCFYFIQLKI